MSDHFEPSSNRDDHQQDWWKSFHVLEMADLFLVRHDQDELSATLDFLMSQAPRGETAHAYDQCCGIGSLSIGLAARGMRTTGADLCEPFIARAIRDASLAGVTCEFHCADAFRFMPGAPCDLVFNWYSSFGYADSDLRNREMLERAFEALKPRGRYILDVPNLPALLRGFQRHMVRRGESAGRKITLIRDSEVDLRAGVLRQLWTWLIEGESPIERQSSLRLYLPHQIRELLEQCGFHDVRFFGNLKGKELSLDDARLLCVATKSSG